MLRASVPFALSELFTSIYMRSDIAIIGVRLDSAAVGQYAPASYLVSALFLIPSSLYMVMAPVLSQRIHALREAPAQEEGPLRRALDRQVGKLLSVSAAVGVALTVGAYLLGPVLVSVLLPNYPATGDILRILSLILIFKTGSFALVAVLVAADRQQERVQWQAVVALLSAALTYTVIPHAGIYGVAWVYVSTEALLLAGYAWLSRGWQRQPRMDG
jgi:O-antigen/teichoic acid export membrane protein